MLSRTNVLQTKKGSQRVRQIRLWRLHFGRKGFGSLFNSASWEDTGITGMKEGNRSPFDGFVSPVFLIGVW